MDIVFQGILIILFVSDELFLPLCWTLASTVQENGLQAPIFLQEPMSRLTFSNDSGSQISCSAHGIPPPLVTWISKDGSIVSSVPGLRQTSGNGTLYFPPFSGQDFRADIHENIYRCRASNQAGTILSRDVYVRAVVRKLYSVHVEGQEVYAGNVAFLRCIIPDYVKDFVTVTSWVRGDEELLPELADITGRYIVTTGNSDLYIRTVRLDDNLKKFACRTVHSLNGEQKLSDPISLSVKEISSNMAPRTNQKPLIDMTVDRRNDIHLPCNIQGNPLPIFTWFRISDSAALYPVPSSQRIIPSQTLLLIKNVDERDAGRWVCKASNQYGDQRVEIRLIVNTYLSVHIHPQVQIINSGGIAVFNCSITGTSIENVEWYHDGMMIKPEDISMQQNKKIKLLTPTSLAIESVGRNDRGIYQCLVTNGKTSGQAMAELKLGDIVPELIHTFIEQNVRPGPHISLKCTANGTPPPQFTWLLDGQPIMDISLLHRYAIGQFVDGSGDVISHLNISHIRTDDGGLYKCIATNSMGSTEHSARLNVYGPPYVRATGPIKSIAGSILYINCPFSGYPIESVRWEKSHQEIISNSRYEVTSILNGGSLKINQVDASHDSGLYTCIVKSRTGEEARRDLELIVNSPPVIEPFSFPKNLQEGGRAQVTCSVSSGDMPVYFSWKKDDGPIPLNLQVTEKKDEFFTLLVFKDISSRHSGKYTCFATNSAAKVNYTSEMLVRVPPRWIFEPKDTAVMLGNPIAIYCEADGYPVPTITWLKGQGKLSQEFKTISLKNTTLIVDFATDSDEGYYMCQSTNGIGPGLKKIIHINVNEPSRFDHATKNVSSRRNDPVTLSCMARGDEPINIVWSHNNARIDLNNYRISIAEMKTSDGVSSQLSISRSDRQDSGLYKCIAENPFGKSEHIIYLAVQERPDTPSNLEIIEVNSRSVKLAWRRPFDGNSPVLSYIVQYQPIKYLSSSSHSVSTLLNSDDSEWNSSHTVNLTLPTVSSGVRGTDGIVREHAILSGLHPSTTYQIRMLAVNEIERSAFTDPIVIKTQEEAPREAPSNVQVQAGGMGELIVTWQLPSKDTWNGELLGYTVNCTEEKQNINYITTLNATSRKSIKVDGFATTKTTISGLRTYRRYTIIVRAVNSYGPGPWSSPVYGATLEGVPEAAPQNFTCTPLSSQSIKISWTEPPAQYQGGIIQGYKIIYRPLVDQIDVTSNNEIKRTSNLETYLHALYKATNYSIRVLAYTSSGDGLSTNPIYCTTDDDVPEPPASIKAAALTGDSILVSWLRPKHKNGNIQHYTVYSREAGRKGQAKSHIVRVDEAGNPVTFEARGLTENQMYEFWVSASTSVGEGEPTVVIAQATNTRAPARIASFSQLIQKPVGQSLTLECIAVGNPTPVAQWYTRDRPVTFSPFYEKTASGNLKIHTIESNLSGNYTCSAANLFGEDHVVYTIIAIKPPTSPQITVQYASSDNIRISWDSTDDGGTPIQGYTLSYRIAGHPWTRIDLSPETNAYTINGLKCGNQYIIKMSAHNRVGDGPASDEINVWTKGKKSQEPEEQDFIYTNSSCINLLLSAWNNGGCPISHFSVEHRPLGDIRWTVVSSDISNSDDSREHLTFCDFLSATWYQLKISATNDAGKTSAQYNIATTTLNGERILLPAVFTNIELSNDVILLAEQTDWISTGIVGIVITAASMLICVIIKHKSTICGPISDGYESRAIHVDIKDDRDSHRNQQVYTASPVKTVDKNNDSEMYEISPYATFSVAGGRTNSNVCGAVNSSGNGSGSGGNSSGILSNKPRVLPNTSLDYTMQFKTFGHPDSDNLNSTAYPILPVNSNNGGGFGHVKGKSSWQKQRYYNTDEESTLSKSMTIMAGSSQNHYHHRSKTNRDVVPCEPRQTNHRSKSARTDITHHPDSESDTSISPTIDFSNAPTYRIPIKSSRELLRPDSSTESNNDNSPIDRRSGTPRHITAEMRASSRPRTSNKPKESQSMDMLRSSNSSDSEVINVNEKADPNVNAIRFIPPSGFNDSSREFSEAECDRERALDLEVQRVMEKNSENGYHSKTKIERQELTSLLARYQEKKEQERQEYTIHV